MKLFTFLRDLAWMSLFSVAASAISIALALNQAPVEVVLSTASLGIVFAILGTKE